MSAKNPPSGPVIRPPCVLLFGAPGSGKGTQGVALGKVPRFYHMACGDVFRSLDTRTELGHEFVAYSSRGELVPDSITVRLWHAALDARIDAHEYKPDIDLLVLDGIPRNAAQAELMDDLVEVIQVFHLSCPDRNELAIRLRKRALKDNRLDDASDSVIAQRIKTYEEESKAILDHYPSERTTDIDATQQPVKVLHDIISCLVHLPEFKRLAEVPM